MSNNKVYDVMKLVTKYTPSNIDIQKAKSLEKYLKNTQQYQRVMSKADAASRLAGRVSGALYNGVQGARVEPRVIKNELNRLYNTASNTRTAQELDNLRGLGGQAYRKAGTEAVDLGKLVQQYGANALRYGRVYGTKALRDASKAMKGVAENKVIGGAAGLGKNAVVLGDVLGAIDNIRQYGNPNVSLKHKLYNTAELGLEGGALASTLFAPYLTTPLAMAAGALETPETIYELGKGLGGIRNADKKLAAKQGATNKPTSNNINNDDIALTREAAGYGMNITPQQAHAVNQQYAGQNYQPTSGQQYYPSSPGRYATGNTVSAGVGSVPTVNDELSGVQTMTTNPTYTSTQQQSAGNATNIDNQILEFLQNQADQERGTRSGTIQDLQNILDNYSKLAEQSKLQELRGAYISKLIDNDNVYDVMSGYTPYKQATDRLKYQQMLEKERQDQLKNINTMAGNVAIAKYSGLPISGATADKDIINYAQAYNKANQANYGDLLDYYGKIYGANKGYQGRIGAAQIGAQSGITRANILSQGGIKRAQIGAGAGVQEAQIRGNSLINAARIGGISRPYAMGATITPQYMNAITNYKTPARGLSSTGTINIPLNPYATGY